MQYGFLTYKTVYKTESKDVKYQTPKKGDACFSYVFHRITEPGNYVIEIFKGDDQARNGFDNNCFLTKKQLENHINHIKKIGNFSFKITEEDTKFIVNLKIKSEKNIVHRFILTWIRYSYEFPGNFIVYYMIKMKKHFPKLNFISLFHLIEISSGEYMFPGHSFNRRGYEPLKFVNPQTLKRKMDEVTVRFLPLQDMFETISCNNLLRLDRCRTTDDWEAFFNGDMLKFCKNNYKILKEF